jgi:predicted nucleotidyltransferase
MSAGMEDNLNRSGHSLRAERELVRISEKYRLSALYAFGSRAKEVAALVRQNFDRLVKRNSDLDIAVLPEARIVLGAREKVEIMLELEELFGSPRVDLLVLPEADSFLAANAIRGERLYCKDSYAADDFELYVLRRAGDLIPYERERIRMIMEMKE